MITENPVTLTLTNLMFIILVLTVTTNFPYSNMPYWKPDHYLSSPPQMAEQPHLLNYQSHPPLHLIFIYNIENGGSTSGGEHQSKISNAYYHVQQCKCVAHTKEMVP